MTPREKLSETRQRQKYIWLFNISFWLYLALINLFLSNEALLRRGDLLYLALSMLSGILLSYAFQVLLYERFRFHLLPTGLLILLVLEYSLLFAMLRYYCIHLIYYVSFGHLAKAVRAIDHVPSVLRFWFHFIAWSGIYFSIKMYEQVVSQRREAQRAREMAQRAQMDSLRYQLNPRFLFNTLSSLRALTTRDPKKARTVVTKISEFLRYSLSEGKGNEVPLSREIDIIEHYLDIERIHHGENLLFEISAAPGAQDYPIPIFLVQPLVENAVRHGMRTSPVPLKISLKTELIGDDLRISVTNSGHWIEPQEKPPTNGTGTGLANVQRRLQHFFPGRHRFEIQKDDAAVIAVIVLHRRSGESAPQRA